MEFYSFLKFFYGFPIYWVTQFTYFCYIQRHIRYICLCITKNLILFYYRILIFPFFLVHKNKYFVGLFISLHFHMHIYIYPLLLPPTSNILSRYILKVLFSLRSYFSFWLFHAKLFNTELRNFFPSNFKVFLFFGLF